MHRSELGEMQSASERELTVGRRVLQDRGRTWSEQNQYHLRWRWWCEDHPSSRVLTLSAPSFLFKLQRGLTWKKTASVHFDACDNFFSLNEKYYPIYIYIYIQTVPFFEVKKCLQHFVVYIQKHSYWKWKKFATEQINKQTTNKQMKLYSLELWVRNITIIIYHMLQMMPMFFSCFFFFPFFFFFFCSPEVPGRGVCSL